MPNNNRQFTVYNRDHWGQLWVKRRDTLRKWLHSLSNTRLLELVIQTREEMDIVRFMTTSYPVARSHKIDFLMTEAKHVFEADWLEAYGWPFSDCFDKEKLAAHLAGMKKLQDEVQARMEAMVNQTGEEWQKPAPVEVAVES